MPRQFKPDDEKFEELVLYIAARSEDDPKFSATKLNKLLFFADFLAYANRGESITGHRYQKLPYGPAPVALMPIIRKMEARGDCEWAERNYFGRPQRRLVAHRGADMSGFSEEELALVDDLIAQVWDQNATEVSDLSHQFAGWQAVELQEEIPYETIFVLPPRPLTQSELQHARDLASS